MDLNALIIILILHLHFFKWRNLCFKSHWFYWVSYTLPHCFYSYYGVLMAYGGLQDVRCILFFFFRRAIFILPNQYVRITVASLTVLEGEKFWVHCYFGSKPCASNIFFPSFDSILGCDSKLATWGTSALPSSGMYTACYSIS